MIGVEFDCFRGNPWWVFGSAKWVGESFGIGCEVVRMELSV